MPKTISLVLDDDLARRLEAFAKAEGFDAAGALDYALRTFLDHEDRARAAIEAVVAATRDGEDGAAPGLAVHHDDIRRWLLSWGSETERKRPRSC
ncbi:transcriptional regulator [Magnetospirillum sp. SS-4]|uniref:transcriptional regulator n=1 Tax=Magnetospirillum sp. SS-4 TaxID=2681465 RepID=UPI001381BA81|nr:transcriptional regulator [Magnetospirillum sp. SS-4]CAA7619827.1 Predicted transcriptional regulator [Magnetospirillum sp. SS-4]